VAEFGGDEDEEGVSAAGDEGDVGFEAGEIGGGRFAGDPGGIEVGFVVMDTQERLVEGEGEALGGAGADHQGLGKARAEGGRDGIEVRRVQSRLVQGGAGDDGEVAEVFAGWRVRGPHRRIRRGAGFGRRRRWPGSVRRRPLRRWFRRREVSKARRRTGGVGGEARGGGARPSTIDLGPAVRRSVGRWVGRSGGAVRRGRGIGRRGSAFRGGNRGRGRGRRHGLRGRVRGRRGSRVSRAPGWRRMRRLRCSSSVISTRLSGVMPCSWMTLWLGV
jgi:hypothetical protein